MVGQWKSLTKDEWYYLFYSRPTLSGIRFAKANVNGVNGVILLPNAWKASTYALNNTNGGNYGSNTITADVWNVLEDHGAVFLPAAGYRNGTSVSGVDPSSSYGNYWSASYSGSSAHYLTFGSSSLSTYDNYRYYGRSVRLARLAEN